jgi:hypothetical protein
MKQIQILIKPFLINSNIITRGLIEFPELISVNPTKSVNEYKKVYKQLISNNSSVDIFFNTCNYIDFIFESTGLVSINNLDSLISINGFDNLDNSYFTGQYMVYGSSNRLSHPLTAIDVIGHELSHGFIIGICKLEYNGHSGAINESFSHIIGTMFELYMYDKFPNLLSKKLLIREDLGIVNQLTHSIDNPTKVNQPNKYMGIHYIDPNSKIDYGGVHINSGIINYCFYLACQKQDKKQVLTSFIKCLHNLSENSNFMDFRDQLKIVTDYDPNLIEALNNVGLTDIATLEYNPQPHQCTDCPIHCKTHLAHPITHLPHPWHPFPPHRTHLPHPRTHLPHPRTHLPHPWSPLPHRRRIHQSRTSQPVSYYNNDNYHTGFTHEFGYDY